MTNRVGGNGTGSVGPLNDLLVDEFVARVMQRRLRDKDVQAARDCLRRLAIDSGYRSTLDGLEARGTVVVAHKVTDGAARALGSMAGYYYARGRGEHADWYMKALCFVPRRSALEELLGLRRLARGPDSEAIERAINTYHDLLERRARPLSVVVMQHPDGGGARSVTGWRPDEYGWRLARITPGWVYEGWVRPDGTSSLGIQQTLELGLGEAVFESEAAAFEWGEARRLEVRQPPLYM